MKRPNIFVRAWRRIKNIFKRTAPKPNYFGGRRPLNEREVLWIFAVKDRRINEHYRMHYSRNKDYFDSDGNVKQYILLSIWTNIVDNMHNGWKEVISNIRIHDHLFYSDTEQKYTLREAWDKVMYEAIKTTFTFVSVSWLDKYAEPNWEEAVAAERQRIDIQKTIAEAVSRLADKEDDEEDYDYEEDKKEQVVLETTKSEERL